MSPIAVRNDLLALLWFDTPAQAPPMAFEQVATAINQAFQILWLSPADYLRRATDTLTTVTGTESYDLPAIQDVLMPVQCDGRPLIPVASKAAFAQAAARFLGHQSLQQANGFPRLFHVERAADPDQADPVAVALRLCPVPEDEHVVTYDYSQRCPRFTAATLANDEPPLPIPNEYVEAVLLPVARFCITSSHWFEQPDKLPGLEAGFAAGLQRLGFSDPQIATLRQSYGMERPAEPRRRRRDEPVEE